MLTVLVSLAQTLSSFLSAVFAKKYTNPSSDIIAVLAGLDQVDTVFTEFVGSLDGIIRNGRTCELDEKSKSFRYFAFPVSRPR